MPTEIGWGPSDGFLDYIMVLDQNYTQIDLIDTFESFYWIERYNSTGDFEFVMPVIEKHLPAIRINNYISVRESEEFMIIEDVTLETDPTYGDKLKVSGRTLSSILSRRIVWHKTVLSNTTTYQIIRTIVLQNFEAAAGDSRWIKGFQMTDQTADPSVRGSVESIESFGDNVYDVVQNLCESANLGFRIRPLYPSQTALGNVAGFEFSLYSGVDRSWSQTENVPVVFSHSYENLLDSDYVQTEVNYISNALVRGDEDDITMEVMRKNERTGLARREMFIDTDLEPETQEISIPVTDDGGNTHQDTETRKIYDMDYYYRMLELAKVEMAKHKVTEAFDSEVDIYHQFFYGKDYFLGDIVQVENRYGFSGRCRITEILKSRDSSGPRLVPSFVMVDENGDEVTTT